MQPQKKSTTYPRRVAERYEGNPGVMRTYTGKPVDLANFSWEMIDKLDISTSLWYNVRWNGHLGSHFSVWHHSLIGSYMADSPRHKMEALLHDVSETYTGDVTLPMKEMFPAIGEFEDILAGTIFETLWPNSGLVVDGIYQKTPYMIQLDRDMAAAERYHYRPNEMFTERARKIHPEWYEHFTATERALEAEVWAHLHSTLTDAIYNVFWNRYEQIKGELKDA